MQTSRRNLMPWPGTILLHASKLGLAALLAAMGFSGCRVVPASHAPSAEEGPAPPGGLWRGVHLFVNAAQVEPLKKAIAEKLAPMGINVIVLEVDYGFEYQSHPELRWANPISKQQARELLEVCRKHGIRLIPQFQCLGHQSWAAETHPLLIKYPELDETPKIPLNNPGIYCRSWCPLHPKVNKIIFALIDELIDAFEADAFHVGMDEVYCIASDQCVRCRGKDPADLDARAINDLHGHIVGKRGLQMLMWADMLIDSSRVSSSTTWGAPTQRATEMIPKDIIMCDWQYGVMQDYPSIKFFIDKGFRVWPSSWNSTLATKRLIEAETRYAHPRMIGHLYTTWSAGFDIFEPKGAKSGQRHGVGAVIKDTAHLIRPAPASRLTTPSATHVVDRDIHMQVELRNEGNFGKPIRSASADILIENEKGERVKSLGRVRSGAAKPKDVRFRLPVGSYRAALRGEARLEGGETHEFKILSPPFRVAKAHPHAALGANVRLAKPFSPKYNAGGKHGLTNGILGKEQWALGDWQGFNRHDLDATIDLGRAIPVHTIRTTFLQDQDDWIFLPTSVEYAVSADGASFRTVAEMPNTVSPKKSGSFIHPFEAKFPKAEARYVRVRARNIGVCPQWHKAKGQPAWVFVDEMMVNPEE